MWNIVNTNTFTTTSPDGSIYTVRINTEHAGVEINSEVESYRLFRDTEFHQCRTADTDGDYLYLYTQEDTQLHIKREEEGIVIDWWDENGENIVTDTVWYEDEG
jgi:uncharacterized protein YuzE